MSLSVCGTSSFINNRIIWNYGIYYNNNFNIWNDNKIKMIQKEEYIDNKVVPFCAGILKLVEQADYLKRRFKFNLSENLIWIITHDKDIFEMFRFTKNYSDFPIFKKYYDKFFKKSIKGFSAVFVHPTIHNLNIPTYDCYFSENDKLNKNIQILTATSNLI